MNKSNRQKQNNNQDLKNEGFAVKLAQPAIRALNSAGIFNLEQLAQFQENELLKLHGIGPNAIAQLRQALISRNLDFKN